jgi:hypothetical protein
MRSPHHARAAAPSAVRYAAVSVAVLLGFLTLLAAAAHPVPVATAVAGAVVGVVVGRARVRAASVRRRPATDSEELTDPGPA